MSKPCEICAVNEAVGVCSSTLGAFSFAICRECIKHNAEPLGMLIGMLKDAQYEVAEWVKKMTTFYEGEYINFDAIVVLAKSEVAPPREVSAKYYGPAFSQH